MRLTDSRRLIAFLAALLLPASALRSDDRPFTDKFLLRNCTFTTTGRNAFFILEPGYRMDYEGEDDGRRIRFTSRVLDETIRLRGGRDARVVEERFTDMDGQLIETSRNYLVMCVQNGNVYLCGEDVDIYENGQVVSHEGTWRAGVGGARAGLYMPGLPLVGSRYLQENAPGVSQDRCEIVGQDADVTTPAGRFAKCLRIRETNPVDPDELDVKFYAPGVGLVRDGLLALTSYGFDR